MGFREIRGLSLTIDEQLSQVVIDAAALEIILAGVMGIERRTADVGCFANIFDGDCLVALLRNQGE